MDTIKFRSGKNSRIEKQKTEQMVGAREITEVIPRLRKLISYLQKLHLMYPHTLKSKSR